MSVAHLDADALADLQEGLLDKARSKAAATHLARCDACARQARALDDVRLELRRAGGTDVTAVPEDVVRRLDRALAEAATPAAAAGATVTSFTRTRTPWSTRVLQAAAVFVLLAAAAGIGYGAIGFGSSGSSDDTAASPAKAAGGAADSGQAEGDARAGASSFQVTESGRDYTAASLRAAVPDLLAGRASDLGAAPSATGSAGRSQAHDKARQDSRRLASGPALADCVANLALGPVTPLAVDIGSFEGRPATVIVLPTPGDADTVDVFAVEPQCRPGELLIFQRVPAR